MRYLFELPLLLLIGYFIYDLIVSQKNPGIEDRFARKSDNKLHNMSFLAPYRWVIPEDENDPKAIEIERQIQMSDLGSRYSYRSVLAYQLIWTMIGVAFMLIGLAFVTPLMYLITFGFNLNPKTFITGESLVIARTIIFAIGVMPGVVAKKQLLKKSKINQSAFIRDLPLLQTYIILMLGNPGTTINNVLRMLSITKTTYQPIFQKGYRIWLRDPDEGFDFIKKQFEGTLMLVTVSILGDFDNYDRSETIRTLENNREDIINFSKSERRRVEVVRNLFNQIAVVFPFVAVIMLAIGPVFHWAMKLFGETGLF